MKTLKNILMYTSLLLYTAALLNYLNDISLWPTSRALVIVAALCTCGYGHITKQYWLIAQQLMMAVIFFYMGNKLYPM